jgi:fused signal recognition particle receptor
MAGFFKKLFNRIAGRKDLPESTSEVTPETVPEVAQETWPQPERVATRPVAPQSDLAVQEPETDRPLATVEPEAFDHDASEQKPKPAKPRASKKQPAEPKSTKSVKLGKTEKPAEKTDNGKTTTRQKVKTVAIPEKSVPQKLAKEKSGKTKSQTDKPATKPGPSGTGPKKLAERQAKVEAASAPAQKVPLVEKTVALIPQAKPLPEVKTAPLPVEPRQIPQDQNPASQPDPEPAPKIRQLLQPTESSSKRAIKTFAKPKQLSAPAAPLQEPERRGWFSRLKNGLAKSSQTLTGSITSIFTKRKLDKETLQDLEDTLIQADLGIAVSERIIKAVSTGRYEKEIDPEDVKRILADEVASVLRPVEIPFNFGEEKPFVILVVGVNGSGKTTTIGKLGAIASGEGFKVKLVACDTFRAAAIEQLTVWGQRIGAETMSRPAGSDAAGLAFDAMKAAQADGTDIVFIDTAGRLHNKTYLMDELDKVVRVIKKYDNQAPHAVLLVLDATTGQNALAQAEAFTKVAGVTGLIMTKLDGTARGGILVAIAEAYKLPIHAIGVGETIDDLQPFDAEGFARAIAGLELN